MKYRKEIITHIGLYRLCLETICKDKPPFCFVTLLGPAKWKFYFTGILW